MPHQFGGVWTERKLSAVREYLEAYRKIFVANPFARFFRTVYVDGFAGSGERIDSRKPAHPLLFDYKFDVWGDSIAPQDEKRKRGSVRVALDIHSPFDEYLFIEKHRGRASQLSALLEAEYPDLAARCRVKRGDANEVLQAWCAETDWRKTRAVVFLDPYGMTVEWQTIKRIAATKAIDLWILFPLGAGINRLLTKGGKPPAQWAAKLDRILGTPDWRSAFYRDVKQHTLWGEEERTIKVATFKSMGDFFLNRLGVVFEGVSPHTLPLRNSRGNPMYLLCFAAGSRKGAATAVKIANHLLTRLGRA